MKFIEVMKMKRYCVRFHHKRHMKNADIKKITNCQQNCSQENKLEKERAKHMGPLW